MTVFSAVIIGIFFALASIGPRAADGVEAASPISEEARALRDESLRLEEEFERKIVEQRTDEEVVSILTRAVTRQEEYIASLPARDYAAEARLEQLRQRHAQYRGELLAEQAERVEAEGRAVAETSPQDAIRHYRTALRIREEIRSRYPSSSYNDVPAITRLQRQVNLLEVTPMREASDSAEEAGREAAREGRIEKAIDHFRQALELQEQINREYGGTRLADPVRAIRLKDALAEMQSAELRESIDDLVEKANQLVFEDKHSEAAGLFDRAHALQVRLNTEFPRSPFASAAREQLLREREANASGLEDYLRILDLDVELRRKLASGDFRGLSALVESIRSSLRRFEFDYPPSTLPLGGIRQRVEFIQEKRDVVEEIYRAVSSDLVPMPGQEGLQILATEVPQYLYSLLMNNNPSRMKGGGNPVETVSPEEAEDFVRRLGWILGRTVRLPYEREFRELTAVVEGGDVWSLETSEGSVRAARSGEPAPSGIYHLRGNVAEITVGPDGRFYEAGGHARMSAQQIRGSVPEILEPGDRNRMVGFRIVVEDGISMADIERHPTI